MSRLLAKAWLVLMLVLAVSLTGCKFDGIYDLPMPGGNSLSDEQGYDVDAEFADVLNVVPRSPVMVNDVSVGQVISVDRVGWHAKLKLRIRNDIELPKNAIAEIRQTSLLGEKFVALVDPEVPSSQRLGEGDSIPLPSTGKNPEVEEVLGALSFLLSGGGVSQIKTIGAEMNKIMTGRTQNIQHLMRQMNKFLVSINGQKDDIFAAMRSINSLAKTLNKEKRTFTKAVDAMTPAIRVLNRQHKTLLLMLQELDKLGVVGTRVVRASRNNLVATLRHLGPTLRGLADADESLVKGLSLMISYPFPQGLTQLVYGDYANAKFHVKIDFNDLPFLPPLPFRNNLSAAQRTKYSDLSAKLNNWLANRKAQAAKAGGSR